jgi:hypothetical protein
VTVSVDAWQRLWTELGAGEVPRGLYNQLVAAYSERGARQRGAQRRLGGPQHPGSRL